MLRDRLLLAEIIDATERIVALTARRSVDEIEADWDRRDALLWNYTVLGEAVSQLSEPTKAAHREVPWNDPVRMRNPHRARLLVGRPRRARDDRA
jgi:uncharacterized protein with HEPN domain